MDLKVRHQIGQNLIIGIQGPSLLPEERAFILANNIGGIALFARNCESPEQIHSLITELQGLRHQLPDKSPLFIGIDQEGGRVARLKEPFTQWPPLQKVGALNSTTLGFKYAESMGTELLAAGINLDFAPCIDVLTNPDNQLIGDRSLSSDPDVVSKIGSSLVRGYIKSGIIACAKHFPGHGNTLIDSHEDLPIEENVDLNMLMERELQPFKKAFRARLNLVMTAHIKFPKIDPDWPVTLSSIFINEVLKEKLGYRQLVITDDLDMKALRNHYEPEEIAVRSLQAGANILLYCNEPVSPAIGLEAIEKAIESKEVTLETIEYNHKLVLDLKSRMLSKPDPLPLDEFKAIVGNKANLELSKCVSEGRLPEGMST